MHPMTAIHRAFSAMLLTGLVLLSIITLGFGARRQDDSLSGRESKSVHGAKVIVWTNKNRYSLNESVQLEVAIRNEGDAPLYLDRRMFWGYGAGLLLDIRDEQDKHVAQRVRDDALMPPPMKDDPLPLVRLEEWQFLGTTRLLHITKDFPLKPGKYSIRVKYKSWLYREDFESRFRDLNVMWRDDPAIVSEPVWIEVTR